MSETKTPTEVVSSIKDQSLPNRISAADARAKGRYGYDKPTPACCWSRSTCNRASGVKANSRHFGS